MNNLNKEIEMNSIFVQNEFGVWVHDIFAEWLSVHALGEIIDPNPIHNATAIDIFDLTLMGVTNE
jgi:hypothetical protein